MPAFEMSDAYERERQNNDRLSELSAKVTALRGVTVDIYDNARAQDVIDSTVSRTLCICGAIASRSCASSWKNKTATSDIKTNSECIV